MNTSASMLRTRAETDLTPGEDRQINVGEAERLASTLGGGLLAAYGLGRLLKHPSLAGMAATVAGGAVLYRGVSGYCPAYGSLGVDTAHPPPVRIRGAFTIDRSPGELYDFWRQLDNLPLFLHHLESVQALDEKTSRWRLRLPRGYGLVEWQAEITEDRPGNLLAWRSLPGSDLENAGQVHFAESPGGRGTEMHALLEYRAPGGGAGGILAGLLNPLFSQLVREDLRRFKNLMEAGEIPTIAGQPAAR